MDFKKIAESFGFGLVDHLKDCKYPIKDCSFAISAVISDIKHYQIVLGIYSDEEKRIAAFFHELGHCLDICEGITKYQEEASAWDIGFQLMKEYGVVLSGATHRWCKKRLDGYRKHDNEIPRD